MNFPKQAVFHVATAGSLVLIWLASAGGQDPAGLRSGPDGRQKGGESTGLELLFHLELRHTGQVVSEPLSAREGEAIGGGEGRIEGRRIRGAVLRWSNFEQTLREGLCTIQVPAEVRTDDGAQIGFEGRGNAIMPDPAQPNKWRSAAVLRFQTADPRYQWLNGLLALWDGDFDTEKGLLRARVYARP